MVLARLHEIYEIILLPFGENQRYDLVIDTGSEFIRVQCKTGRLRNGVIRFNACSSTYHHPNRSEFQFYQRAYYGQADVFGIYCPDNKKTYLVPVSHIGKRAGSLRIDRTLNNQALGIRWAGDYELRDAPSNFGSGTSGDAGGDVDQERLFEGDAGNLWAPPG